MDMLLAFLFGLVLGMLLALIASIIIFKKNKIDSLFQDKLKDFLINISKDTLWQNASQINHTFSDNLNNILLPFKESLKTVDQKVAELELRRQGAYSSLKEQIEGLSKSSLELKKEATNLRHALSNPGVKGRWGEMQLKRCVELSGLSSLCDFIEQSSIKTEHELLRPDMIITLPKDKKIVIDAKAPLENLMDLDNDADKGKLSATFRRHIASLNKKAYFKAIGSSPEFVIMFVPTEGLLSKALLLDPLLIDYAAQNEVILATPTTLIAILKAIAFSLRQDKVAENIEEVRKLSQELIDRVHKVAEHFEKLGKSLKNATECYNQTLSSLESRVLITAKKIAQLKDFAKEQNLEKSNLEAIQIEPKNFNPQLPQ